MHNVPECVARLEKTGALDNDKRPSPAQEQTGGNAERLTFPADSN
jgi:hypothetical protein